MEREQEAIVIRLRKLIAKQEGCEQIGNAEEAALYAAKVIELAARHQIDLASLGPADAPAGGMAYEWVVWSGPGARTTGLRDTWARTLAEVIGEATQTYFIMSRGGHVGFAGQPVARQTAVYLFAVLFRAMHRLRESGYHQQRAALIRKGLFKVGGNNTILNGYRDSYSHGFLSALNARLKELFKQMEGQSPGMGLILANQRGAVQKWMETQKVKGIPGRRRPAPINGVGLRDGVRDGEQVPIAKGVAAGDQAPAPRIA